jgi:hypothetical protein
MRRRVTGLLLALAMLSTMSLGCIGHFGLSQKVRKFNLETSQDRWGREIIFVALYVIPVYPFAGLLDILIFNSVEFWTGKNPISEQPSVTPLSFREVEADDGSRMLMTLREDRSIDVELEDPYGQRFFMNLIQTPDGVVARDRAGDVVASASDLTGPRQNALRRNL